MQARTQLRTVRDDRGDRVGFQGKRYRTLRLSTKAYADTFTDYLGFLEPRLEEAHRLLTPTGSFFFHTDYREVHYCKVMLDSIFGRDSFVNEIIWAYDYGARATKRWSPKHDNILWYAKNPEHYTYRFDDIDRIPYMAPGLVGPEKAERGKTPTAPGGTPSSAPTARKGPATPPGSPSPSSTASSRSTPTPATARSTSSPAAEPSAKPRPGWGAPPCWWTTTRRQWR